NQSGIYYDVDYDQNDLYKPSGIPMKVLNDRGYRRGRSGGIDDDDWWLYDDFRHERPRGNSPTTSL
ncbi:hypothetical protein GWI33_000307, partial [Rhynchophorus ferrugineus]